MSGDGVHVSAAFSRPERGRTAKSLTEVHLVLVFPVFLKGRLVAAPLTLAQGALKQPNDGTKAPVTNDLVLTGGLAIPKKHICYFYCRLAISDNPLSKQGNPTKFKQMARPLCRNVSGIFAV